jgi:hypothetical protein
VKQFYVLIKKIPREDFDATIVFYNSKEVYSYQKPEKLYDNSSAVFCAPDNYEIEKSRRGGDLSNYLYGKF